MSAAYMRPAVNRTMSKDTFSDCHPIINMLYFILVIGCTIVLTHPVFLALSFICTLTYSIYLNGKRAVRFNLLYMLPLLVITALLNPAFSHQGVTIITYLPDGNPLTLESILYGISAAFLLITVITWFSCFNAVMTSDKFIYLFGRVIPALSLVLSMSLRFVPRFTAQIKVISNARKCMGRDMSTGNLLKRAKHGVKILSILATWALENAIDTADSMKSRGYGLPGRTAFSIYRFDKRDKKILVFLLFCGTVTIAGVISGELKFIYYPVMSSVKLSLPQIVFLAIYLVLCITPMLLNVKETLRWKTTQPSVYKI
jgi:energy-coupling factor transport system permease protein